MKLTATFEYEAHGRRVERTATIEISEEEARDTKRVETLVLATIDGVRKSLCETFERAQEQSKSA